MKKKKGGEGEGEGGGEKSRKHGAYLKMSRIGR